MGQVLHGCARTTEAVRRAIQHSQESLRALARRHGVNPKTIAKWRARADVADRRTGPAEPRSTTLSAEEEAIVIAFRRHTLLPLDDCLYALQSTIPHLTRSALHRASSATGSRACPRPTATSPLASASRPILSATSTSTSPRSGPSRANSTYSWPSTALRSSAFVQLHERATTRIASDFLRALLLAVPYRVHTVLTDNGQHFTTPGNIASAAPLIREAIDRVRSSAPTPSNSPAPRTASNTG